MRRRLIRTQGSVVGAVYGTIFGPNIHNKMTKITAACFGVLVLVTYFSTPVSSQNGTAATPATPANHTVPMAYSNSTMMQTHAYSNATNATTPSGATSFTRSGPSSLLLPVVMVASLVCSRS